VKQLAYTGERLGAAQAKQLGLVNDVFPTQEKLLEHVMGVAAEIARKNPLAVTGCKTMINYGRDHSTADTLQFVGVWNGGMLSTAHVQEAATAQAQKREAHFEDLLPVRTSPM
jgi:enoyl-CoA hydratase